MPSEPNSIGISEGVIIFEGLLPSPWPAKSATVLIEKRFPDGVTRLTAETDGSLVLTVYNSSGECEHTGRTCRIQIQDHNEVKVGLSWKVGENFGAIMNGTFIASSSADTNVPDVFVVPERRPRVAKDYARDNTLARSQRRDRYKGWQPRRNRTRADESYVSAELRSGLLELRDLLAMVEAGRTHHVAGLASIIRKLIAIGDPLPHLQLVAAAKGLPLIVYTDRERIHLVDEALEQLSFSIWSQPNRNEDNPIDLDVWLDLKCGLVVGAPVTNREMLTKIGDTIGAHFDIELHDYLLMLKSYDNALSGSSRSFLLDYLTRVAHAVASLIETTLSK